MALKQRLYAVLVSILVLGMLVAVLLLSQLTRQQVMDDDQQRLNDLSVLLTQDIVFAVVTDDLTRLEQRLNVYVGQTYVKSIDWQFKQYHLRVQAQQELLAPNWFIHLLAIEEQQLRQPLQWLGKDYGTLLLVSDATHRLNQLWLVAQQWLWVLLGLIIVMIVAIESLMQSSIHLVYRLAQDAERLGNGELEEPIRISGQAELRRLASSMEKMRASFLSSLKREQSQQEALQHVSEQNKRQNHWLDSLLNHVRMAIVLENAEGELLFVNKLACQYFQVVLPPSVLLHKPAESFFEQIQLLFSESGQFIAQRQSMIAVQKPVSKRLMLMKDGRWLMHDYSPILDSQSLLLGHVWTFQDVTDTYQLRQTLSQERDLAQVTLSSIGDAVITTDTHGVVTFLNQEAERLTGWSSADAKGHSLTDVFVAVHEDAPDIVLNPVLEVIATGKKVELSNHTLVMNCLTGQKVPIEDSVAPIFDSTKKILGAVLVFHDVSEKYALEQALRWQATHDSLTQLMSRKAFEDQLPLVQSSGQDYALLYCDLDNFKLVNDTAGHLAGDELLRQITALLQDSIAAHYFLARLGGDEFAVLLQGSESEAMSVANLICNVVSQHHFQYAAKNYAITTSIGVVADIGAQKDALMLMAMADAACYAAKHAGGNRVWLYRDEDVYLLAQQAEMEVVSDIREALANNRFKLYAQRLVDLQSGPVGEHIEILVRLYQDERLIYPDAFIPAAEKYGLMVDIDKWVVSHTLAFLHQHRGFLTDVEMCAINLSAASLVEEGFVEFVRDQIQFYKIPGNKLCFEITETAAVARLEHAERFIRDIQSLGCHFALDDFGAGHSSFRYLKHLPANILKIDGGFVQDMLKDNMNQALVKGMVSIAKSLDMQTIAEFVENADTVEALKAIGVNYAQGWYFHRAEPLSDMLKK